MGKKQNPPEYGGFCFLPDPKYPDSSSVNQDTTQPALLLQELPDILKKLHALESGASTTW